ncbi:hypothetical protein [Bdellovibrio sp. GT3]|uniref:hypothetical protein n=1 Tax=Bdellovibrio sp. GT3 TaxID=3136282 RepID=UPI0030F06B5D
MHHDLHNVDDGLSNPHVPLFPSVADDQKIRKDLFSASSELIRKIRRLEKDHADFLLCDQTMYQDWHALTFREELQELEMLEKRHRILTTFEVHLNHVAATSKVSRHQAYNMLKEEEGQYQAGDDVWKFVIDNLRKSRFHAATLDSGLSSESRKPLESAAVDFAEVFFKDDSLLSGLKRRARSVYHYLNDIDDGKMVQHMEVPLAGYRLFRESLQIAMKCGDWRLLGRVWKTANPAYQQRYLRNMPLHLKKFMQRIIAENEREEALEDQQTQGSGELRDTYQKLMRILHPDKQTGETFERQQWASVKWQRVQDVFAEQNLESLKRIELVCRAELGQLNDLTVDEIHQSTALLEEEFEDLKKSFSACRQHPAWKFSSRRGYENLKEQALADLEKRLEPLREEVLKLEEALQSFAAAK